MDQFKIKQDETNTFKRPQNKEDIKYRKIKRATFETELKKVLYPDCTLCFHGTTIWNTQKILKSKNISAEIDRIGQNGDVLDMPGKISVSTVNNVWFTIKHFADLGNYNYPAGCIFVIEPKNEEEIKSSTEKNYINNIDFEENPERIKYIITTPENIELVKKWINESGLKINSNIVVDYDEVITNMHNEYQMPQHINL